MGRQRCATPRRHVLFLNRYHEMQVDIWNPANAPTARIVLKDRRYLPAGVWGFIGTLFVHLVLVPTVFLDIGMIARPARILHEVTAQFDSKSQDLVLIDIPATGEKIIQLGPMADLPLRTRPLLLKMAAMQIVPDVPSVDISPDSTDRRAPSGPMTPESDAESSSQARLVGIYTGQIRARIERVWRRPRSPVSQEVGAAGEGGSSDESFECLVTIVQDATGRVLETDLLRCNGSPAWQQSLVIAINQASPLPAPPDPKVFVRSVTLNFMGLNLAPGMPSDEYESRVQNLAEGKD
jgi:hypothetical protein